MKKFILEFIDVKALHDSYYGSGKLMLRALKKYGKENFKREYLHVFNDDQWELAFAKEKEYVTRDFTLRDDTYNLSEGGSVNPVMYGENNPFYGKKHTQETIDKIQDSRSWYEMTDETKEKISEGGKEVWKREGYKEKMVYIHKNRDNSSFKSEEFKERIREIHTGKIISNEMKQHLREEMTGRKCEWNQITNKDPEKIRKTAEKHRGMKRSEEAKQNMRNAQRKRYELEGKEATNKGKIAINNPETKQRKYINKEDIIPEGFILGYGSTKKDNI